jgi:hypothetical protein
MTRATRITCRGLTVIAVAVPLLSVDPARAADDSLESVLKRAAVYTEAFRIQLSSLVAEETYVQDVRNPMGNDVTLNGRGATPVAHRELKSDLLMVRPEGRYVEFRDVFEVDGKPVRDRQERLTDLFLSGKNSTSQQIEQIAQEGARFNIGAVYRNFNTPTLSLLFLEEDQQPRFRFSRADAGTRPRLGRDWRLPADAADRVWVIEYREAQPRTIIRRMVGGGDMPAHGYYWLDAPTGQVLMAELEVGDPLIQCTIDVRYGSSMVDGLLVPAEMRERYVNNRSRGITTGTATYGRVRRFGVDVQDDLPALPAPANTPGR